MAFKGGGRPNNYLNTGGDKLPSVTTILGRFKDSGPLLHWAFGQGKAAERGEIRRLYDKRDEAAEIGTVAHDMAEAHIHKIDPMACLRDSGLVEDHAHTALQAFEMFERWEQIANVEWTHTEVPVVSERLQVGGTIDAVANVAGKLCIVDFNGLKTGILLWLVAVSDLAALSLIVAITRVWFPVFLISQRSIPVMIKSPSTVLVRATRLIEAVLANEKLPR